MMLADDRLLHFSAVPSEPSNVGYWGQNGKHLFRLSFSALGNQT